MPESGNQQKMEPPCMRSCWHPWLSLFQTALRPSQPPGVLFSLHLPSSTRRPDFTYPDISGFERMEENISVSVRVRPLGAKEEGEDFGWEADEKSIWQVDRAHTRYSIDNVFGPMDTTRHIYDTSLHQLVDKVVAGFNSTVFAYGQTSSGKTYTMQGTQDCPGVVTLAVEDVFRAISNCPTREFLCRMSYMELYNEEVNDLLHPENSKLPIHEKDNKVYVAGLTEEIVHDAESVLGYLEGGNQNKHIASTRMNDRSSRSHTVFRMIVESRSQDQSETSPDDGAVLVSTLTLVDLAGSERISKTGSEGLRMKEGTSINRSLLTLGIVINQLATKAGAVSYRDSKLTRILQPSLGGNAKTAILCNITPANCHVEESSNTLRFACRAKKVVNSCTLNEVLSDAALMKRQAKEIEELKRRLQESGMMDVEEQICKMRNELLRLEHERELVAVMLEEEKAKNKKAQLQAKVAAQLMFEKGGSATADMHAMAKRRDTWCPGGVIDIMNAALAGAKRGSGGKTDGSQTDDLESLKSLCEESMLPPPMQKRRTSEVKSGELRKSSEYNADEEMMSNDPAEWKQQIMQVMVDKKMLEEKVNELQRCNNEKDDQIRNITKDLQGVRASYQATVARSPPEQRACGVNGGMKTAKRPLDWDISSRSLEKRNKRLRVSAKEAGGLIENLEDVAFDAINQADASKKSVEMLSVELESARAQVERSIEETRMKDEQIEEIQTQFSVAQNELQGIRGKLDEGDNGMGAMNRVHKEEVSVYQQQIGDLQKERDALEARLTSQDQRVKNRSEAPSAVRGDKDRDLLVKERDRVRKKADEAEGRVRSLVREKADLQNEKNGMQREMKCQEKMIERLTKDLERKESVFEKRKDGLEKDLVKAKDTVAEQDKRMKAQKQEIEQKVASIKQFEGEIGDLKKQAKDGLKEMNRLHQLHIEVKKQLEECEKENSKLKEAEEKSRGAMEEMRRQLWEEQAAKSANAQRADALNSQNMAMSEQCELLSDECSRVTFTLEEFTEERSEILDYAEEERIIEREHILSKLQEAEEAKAKAQQDAQSKWKEIDTLRKELLELNKLTEEQTSSATQEKKALENASLEKGNMIMNLQQQLQLQEASYKELEENIQGAKKHITDLTDEKAKEVWGWQKKYQDLENEHSEKMKTMESERHQLQDRMMDVENGGNKREQELSEKISMLQQKIEDLTKDFSEEKTELSREFEVLKGKLVDSEAVAAQIRKEYGDEIRKLSAGLSSKDGEVSQYKKQIDGLQEVVDADKKKTEAEHVRRMDQQKKDLLHELEKLSKENEKKEQKIRGMGEAVEEHRQFKDMAKGKLLSRMKEVQEKDQQVSRLQNELVSLRNEYDNILVVKEKSDREAESWKDLVKSEQSTEMWISTLVERIHSLQSRLERLEADFDSEQMHVPTLETCQKMVNDLQEDARKAKRAEQELQGLHTAMRNHVVKTGLDSKKFDALLEATKKEYNTKYYKGKSERLSAKNKAGEAKILELDAEIRELRKRIPPTRIEVDISRNPPQLGDGTPKRGGPSCVTNIQGGVWSKKT